MSIRKWSGGVEKVVAGGGATIPVGGVFEAIGSSATHPSYGTWEALPDRIEDAWKEKPITFNANIGTLSGLTLRAKVDDTKTFVNIDLFGYFSVNGVTSTSVESEIANNVKMNGTLLSACGITNIPLTYCDITNCSQTCQLYFSSGSNKIWAGFNKTGSFQGTIHGSVVIPYNSAFTVDRTFKRWKRTA